MSTPVEQKISHAAPELLYETARKKLYELEDLMSFYRSSSQVSLLNESAEKTEVPLSEELLFVLGKAQEHAQFSRGAFSIMLAPLVQLWKLSCAENKVPTHEAIAATLPLCDGDNLQLQRASKTAALKKEGCKIDLGAIGKGYAADVCCDIYQSMGASSAFINLGGNVKALGSRPDGDPWLVGLQHPDKPRGVCFAALQCSNQSVVTSGAYERYQEIDGVRYHHILDGETGYPAKTELKSVTVISSSSLEADALSTAAFVLGLDEGLSLIKESDCHGAVFFTSQNEIYLTKGIKRQVILTESFACYEA
ncbi:MAG: FAD:protein FMN transferase [Coriobacteriia bacterium]|nr:FAD:protein FMN transferase [Coriobacteriia bacterium]